MADDRRGLEQPFLLGREAVNAGREDRLDGGRDLNSRESFRQAIGAAFADQGLGLHQGPDALLQEEGVPLGPLDQKLFERLERAVGSQEGLEEVLGALGG